MNETINRIFDTMKPTEAQKSKLYDRILANGTGAARTRLFRAARLLTVPVAAAAVCLVVTATVFAAWQFLKPADVAERMDIPQIFEAFQGENAIAMGLTQRDGDWEVTLLGLAPGDEIKMYQTTYSSGEGFGLAGAALYAVLAVRSQRGDPIAVEDVKINAILKSPQPVLQESALDVDVAGSFVQDDVLYIAVDAETIGDSLLVSDTDDLQRAFSYDNYTFALTPNAAYEGVNLVFPIPRTDFGVPAAGHSPPSARNEARKTAFLAEWKYYMDFPLADCELVPDSVKPVTESYDYQSDEGWSIAGVGGWPGDGGVGLAAAPFDENGVFRSGIVGAADGVMIIVLQRDADGAVTGMLYKAPRWEDDAIE